MIGGDSMAKLNFQWDLDMSTDISNPPSIGGYFLGIIHEPDHDLTQYVLNDAYLNVNKMGTLPNHDYPSVTFQTCENLLTTKGFNKCVMFINNSSINVVVGNEEELSKEKVAQIQNVVSRELNAKIENIHISQNN